MSPIAIPARSLRALAHVLSQGLALTALIALPALAQKPASTSTSTSDGDRVATDNRAIRVIDGDTIEVAGKIINLYGMDAPELGQQCLHNGALWSCGLDAAYALQRLVREGKRTISCSYWGENPKAKTRSTAVCEFGGRDLAQRMITNGLAVAPPSVFPLYPKTQVKAKKTGLGVWRGQFVMPWGWRQGIRLGEETEVEDKDKTCPVKSVIGQDGKRTHVVPTDKNFKETKIDVTAGGRCYLSDEEARLAEVPPPKKIKVKKRRKKRLRKRRPAK